MIICNKYRNDKGMLKDVLQIIAVCICFDFSFKKMIEDVFMFSANGSPPIPCDILDTERTEHPGRRPNA
jgi:hypothetical protein